MITTPNQAIEITCNFCYIHPMSDTLTVRVPVREKET
jgi:hypothetical protein